MSEKNSGFPYKQIQDGINAIQPGLFDEIPRLHQLPLPVGTAALSELLAWACTPSYVPSILYAREQMQKINAEWLAEHLPAVARQRLNLNDEWEYRRLLEAVAHIPKLLEWALALANESKNPEVVEAAQDFQT